MRDPRVWWSGVLLGATCLLLATLAGARQAPDTPVDEPGARLAASIDAIALSPDRKAATVLVRLENKQETAVLLSLNSDSPTTLFDDAGQAWNLNSHPGLDSLPYESNSWHRPQTRFEPGAPIVVAFRFSLEQPSVPAKRFALVGSLVAASADVNRGGDRWLVPLSATAPLGERDR